LWFEGEKGACAVSGMGGGGVERMGFGKKTTFVGARVKKKGGGGKVTHPGRRKKTSIEFGERGKRRGGGVRGGGKWGNHGRKKL